MKNEDLESLVDLTARVIKNTPEEQRMEAIEVIRLLLHLHSPVSNQPVDYVRWVPVDKVLPNDYNPNKVAGVEMTLLKTSIDHDGYTQPIVTVYDELRDKYIIVDGFHRYFVCKNDPEIRERCKGMVPVTILDKSINDRMASTVRHNRARGKHNIDGMTSMVFNMLENGWTEAEICNELGMEPEEIIKLKHITGFSKLFENAEYSKAWESKRMILLRKRQQQNDEM